MKGKNRKERTLAISIHGCLLKRLSEVAFYQIKPGLQALMLDFQVGIALSELLDFSLEGLDQSLLRLGGAHIQHGNRFIIDGVEVVDFTAVDE